MPEGQLLLVEDDASLGFVTKDQLMAEGYHVDLAADGQEGWEKFRTGSYDLCLLDIMLPKLDGFELAQRIRSVNDFVPIIFLTARQMDEDKWKGFEIGGDDYLTKPFTIKELLYRVAVFMRRTKPASETVETVTIGTYSFDTKNLILTGPEKEYSLTEMEGAVLQVLTQKQGTLVKREEILIKVWGENDYFKGRSLDVFVSRLRKYLNQDESINIRNHHGVGFTLIST